MDNLIRVKGYKEPQILYGVRTGININKVERLLEDITFCRIDAIEQDVNEIFREIYAAGADYRMVRMYRDYLQVRILQNCDEDKPGISKQEVLQFISEHDFNPQRMEGSRILFKRFVLNYAEFRMQFCGQKTANLLLQIKKDIRQNYMKDISLKSLSEKYYISRPYLGQLFRKQFNVCFKDYLNSVRLKNAEKLLLQTDEKVYNIATMVGYNNSDYFINKFTGAKGVTPAKFRKLANNKREDSKKCKMVSNE